MTRTARRLATALATLPVMALSAGCETVSSTDVRTDGIYATLDVEARGDGHTVVTGALRVGGSLSNTYLDLAPGDLLSAYRGDEQIRMREDSDILGAVRYVARFDGHASETYRVELLREHEAGEEDCLGGDAPFSFATLPSPFELDAPAEMSIDDDDLAVQWAPSGTGDSMEVAVTGDCIDSYREAVDDSGSTVVAAGTLEPIEGQAPGGCTLDVTVTRSRTGQVDPSYGEGGSFAARQIRGASVVAEL